MKTEKILNSQRNHEKDELRIRLKVLHFWFQTILQRYGNQNIMVLLVLKHMFMWPMEQYREPKYKPSIFGQLIFDKGAKNTKWVKISSIKGVRTTRYPNAGE